MNNCNTNLSNFHLFAVEQSDNLCLSQESAKTNVDSNQYSHDESSTHSKVIVQESSSLQCLEHLRLSPKIAPVRHPLNFNLQAQRLQQVCQNYPVPNVNVPSGYQASAGSVKFNLLGRGLSCSMSIVDFESAFPSYQKVFAIVNGELCIKSTSYHSSVSPNILYMEAIEYALIHVLQTKEPNIRHLNLCQLPLDQAIILLPYILDLASHLNHSGLEQECASFIQLSVSKGVLSLLDGVVFNSSSSTCQEAWKKGLIDLNRNGSYQLKSPEEWRRIMNEAAISVNLYHSRMCSISKHLLRQILYSTAKNLREQFSQFCKIEVNQIGSALIKLCESKETLERLFLPLLQRAYAICNANANRTNHIEVNDCYVYILAAYFCVFQISGFSYLQSEGFKWIEQLLAHYPGDDCLWTIRGEFYTIINEKAAALQCFNQAITLNPKNDLALTKRAILRSLEDSGCHLVVSDLTAALEVNSRNDEAWTVQGCIFQAQKASQQALEAFDIAIDLNPDNYAARLQRGYLYQYQFQNPQLAFQDFKFIIDKNPYNVQALFAMAVLCMSEKKNVLALNYLHKVLQLNSTHAQALMMRGEIHRLEGKLSLAMKSFNQLVQVDRNNLTAKVKRGRTYIAMKKLADGFADLEAVYKMNPTHIECLIGLAEYFLHTEQNVYAITYFDWAISKNAAQVIALLDNELSNGNEADRTHITILKQRLEASNKAS